jgi:MFS family permease
VARPLRLLVGLEDDPALRPVLAVALLSSAALSTFWSYIGIFAVKGLGASPAAVGVLYLFSAGSAAFANYVAGRLSDRLGRKPLIVFGLGAQSLVVLSLATALHHVALGFGLIVLAGVVGAGYLAAGQAIVADVVPVERRETAYATVRVTNNLGVVLGPPVGGLLLLGNKWLPFLFGVTALGLVAAFVAARVLPSVGAVVEHERAPRGALRVIVRDVPFVFLFASNLLAFVVYVAFETVLPVIAVSSFGLAASTWGFLVILNPALVTVFQLRLTRATAAVPAALKLAVAMALMGLPFLALMASDSVPVIAGVIVVFVIGEMLWAPTTQALVARVAPVALRGAYMGAFSGASSIAWTISPLIALQLRGGFGNGAVWIFYASVSILAAATGVVAASAATARRALEPVERAVEQPLRPGELEREHRQADRDHEQARAR